MSYDLFDNMRGAGRSNKEPDEKEYRINTSLMGSIAKELRFIN